jgi:probable F420-dependent oxidoreductase
LTGASARDSARSIGFRALEPFMPQPTRLALSLPVPGDLDATLARAEWAEQQGFESLWLADSGDLDALTVAPLVAARTRRARIGTAVVPVFSRTPALLASTAATIAAAAPGRFVLGLGASSHTMIESWHGLPFDKPLTRVRETAVLVRRMLAGEKSDFDGTTVRSHGFKVSPVPQPPVPIYLAALMPKMLEMAGEFGDGVVLNLFPLSALPRMLEHVAAGAARSGRMLEDLEIVCRHQVCVTNDLAQARAWVRRRFAPYFATPVYNHFLAWFGYPDAARQIAEGWQEKNRAKTESALSDELIEQIAVIGGTEKCREEIRAFVRAGITTPMIAAFSLDGAEPRDTLEAFVPERFIG